MLVGMVNGSIYEYNVAADMNSVNQKRSWQAHTMHVTGCIMSNTARMIFSCSKDKSIVWHCSETGVKIGSYTVDSMCTSLQFDPDSKICFIGDYNGSIFVLKIVGNTSQLVS